MLKLGFWYWPISYLCLKSQDAVDISEVELTHIYEDVLISIPGFPSTHYQLFSAVEPKEHSFQMGRI